MRVSLPKSANRSLRSGIPESSVTLSPPALSAGIASFPDCQPIGRWNARLHRGGPFDFDRRGFCHSFQSNEWLSVLPVFRRHGGGEYRQTVATDPIKASRSSRPSRSPWERFRHTLQSCTGHATTCCSVSCSPCCRLSPSAAVRSTIAPTARSARRRPRAVPRTPRRPGRSARRGPGASAPHRVRRPARARPHGSCA